MDRRKSPDETTSVAEDCSNTTILTPRRSRRVANTESAIITSSSEHTTSPPSKKRKALEGSSALDELSIDSHSSKRSRSVLTSPSSRGSEFSKRKRVVPDTDYPPEEPTSPTDTKPRAKRQAAVVAASNITSTLSSGRRLSIKESLSAPSSSTMASKSRKPTDLVGEDNLVLASPNIDSSRNDHEENEIKKELASPDKRSKSRSKKDRKGKKNPEIALTSNNEADDRTSKPRSKSRQKDPEPFELTSTDDAVAPKKMETDLKVDSTISNDAFAKDATISEPPEVDEEDDDDDLVDDIATLTGSTVPIGNALAAAASTTNTRTNATRNYDIMTGMSRTTLSQRWRSTLENVKSGEPDKQERALQEVANLLAMTQEGEFSRTMSGFSIEEFVRAWLEILQQPMPKLDESIAQFISELGDAAQDFLEELDPTHSGPIRVLCLRCLTNLLDVNPPSALHLIANDGIQLLVDHCLSITRNEHRDIAENALAVMERLSRDYGEAVIKAGGLEACLGKLEFYSPHYQRVGSAAASFACTRLPISRSASPPAAVPHTLNMIELCAPYLSTLLNHHDAKVVENIVRATSYIVQWAAQWEVVGDRILGVAGDTFLVNALKLITPSAPGATPSVTYTNPTIFSQIVKMFTAISKGLPAMTEKLLVELKVPKVLAGILTNGVALCRDDSIEWDLEELATVVATACQARSSESLLDVLTLASEMLPNLPIDGIWTARIPMESRTGDKVNQAESSSSPKDAKDPGSHTPSAVTVKYNRRVEIIKAKPEILQSYSTGLMPILIDVFGTTANSEVRRKSVECVAKVIAHCSDADLQTNFLLQCKSFGKFVSDLIALKEVALSPETAIPSQDRRDALILVSAGIQIAHTVTTKCGDRLAAIFAREGVLSEMARVIELGDQPTIDMSPAKLAASSSATDLVPYFKQMRNRSRIGGFLNAMFDGSQPGSSMELLNSATNTERLRRLKSLAEALKDVEDDEESAASHPDSKPQTSPEPSDGSSINTEEGKGKAPIGDTINPSYDTCSNDEASCSEKDKVTARAKSIGSVTNRQEYLQTLERLIQVDDTSPPPIPTIKTLNQESISESDIRDWIVWNCRKTISMSRLEEGGLKKKDHVLEELRRLSAELKGLAIPAGEPDAGGLAMSTLRTVAEHFALQGSIDGMGITGYEILESGIVDALAEYLTTPAPRDMVEPPEPAEAEGQAIYICSIMWRLRAFLHVFLNGPTPDPQHQNHFVPNAFRRLVQRLQESLARAERFEIATGSTSASYSSYDGSGLFGSLNNSWGPGPRESQNPSLQLARQLRVKLIADDPKTVPVQYRALLVSVHAVATFQAIEEFLKPKIAHLPSSDAAVSCVANSNTSPVAGDANSVNTKTESFPVNDDENAASISAFTQGQKEFTQAKATAGVEKGPDGSSVHSTNAEELNGDQTDNEDNETSAAVAIREQIGDIDTDEDHDVGDDYHEEDDDDMMDDQTGSHLTDLLLYTEEMQRLNRGQNSTPSSTAPSLGNRGVSVVDLKLDAPSSPATVDSQAQLAQPASSNNSEKDLPPTNTGTISNQVEKALTLPAPSSAAKSGLSYASVAAAGQNSFRVQFIIDDNPIKTSSTIFGALYSHERARRVASGQASTQINVFSQIYSIRFKKLPIDDVILGGKPEPEAGHVNDQGDGGSRLKMRLPFKTSFPPGLPKDAVSGRIMHLLRLLYGLNASWHDVYSEDENETNTIGVDMLEGAAVAAEDSVIRKSSPHSHEHNIHHLPHETTPTALAPVSPSVFTSSKLTAKLNRQLDEPLVVAAHVLPIWCNTVAQEFSFLVPFETRLIYLRSTSFGYSRSMNRWQQQQANISSSRRGDQPQLLGRMSRQKVRIPRSRLIDTMMKVMESWGSSQSLLEIEYQDEVGTGLGPTLEFYSSVCREVRLRNGVMMSAKSKNSNAISHKKTSSVTKNGLVLRNGAYRVWRDDGGVARAYAVKKQQPDSKTIHNSRSKHKISKGKGKPMKESVIQQNDVEIISTEEINPKQAVEEPEDEVINSPLGLFPAPLTREQADSDAGERVLNLFRHLGTFVAKALLDSRIIDLPFSLLFLELAIFENHTTSRGALLHAIKHVDPSLHASLLMLRQCVIMKKMIQADTSLMPAQKNDRMKAIKIQDVAIDELSLDFTLPGYPDIELIENGESTLVTLDNLDLYIDQVAEFTVSGGVMKQIKAFREGFNLVFCISDLRSFTLQELSLMMGGTAEEDWSPIAIADALKADHGYSSTSQQVEWMVNIMAGYDVSQRREFLKFVTGAPKLPYGGFKALSPPLTIVRRDARKPDEDLPSVMTCTNYLKVPAYSSLEIMRRRFEIAIKEGAGCFHLS